MVGNVEYESRQGTCTPISGGSPRSDAQGETEVSLCWRRKAPEAVHVLGRFERVLRCRELLIENLGEQLGYIPVSSLKAGSHTDRQKVVVVGTPYLYYLLNI